MWRAQAARMKPILHIELMWTAARFSAHEQAWCLTANRWGARRVVRAYFRFISQLGDGSFWFALMALLAASAAAVSADRVNHVT